MRAQFLVLATLTLAAAPVAAQGGGQGGGQGGVQSRGAGMRGGQMSVSLPSVDTLTMQLELSAEQQPVAAELVAKYNEETKGAQKAVAAMMAGGGGSGNMSDIREHATKLRDERAKFSEALKAILTDEQTAKYDKLYPARRGRGAGAGGRTG